MIHEPLAAVRLSIFFGVWNARAHRIEEDSYLKRSTRHLLGAPFKGRLGPKQHMIFIGLTSFINTGISSEIRTKLRDWAFLQARAGCYYQAALSSNDSKTLYNLRLICGAVLPD